MYLSSLVRIHEIRHGFDLRVRLVSEWPQEMSSAGGVNKRDIRFGLLAVERIDFASGQHVGQHKIFQDLDTLR
jgi:hypothetical protein